MRVLLWSQVNAGVVVEWVDYGGCCGVRSMRVLLLWSGLNAGVGVVVEWVDYGGCCGVRSMRVLLLWSGLNAGVALERVRFGSCTLIEGVDVKV